jgi:hypothetical protein
MSKYWEATGEVREKLLELVSLRKSARAEMVAFAKRHGSKTVGVRTGLDVSFALQFKEAPDPKLWKFVKQSDGYYVPKESTKAGKALAREMREIADKEPDGTEVNRIIGFEDWLCDGMWHTAGYSVVGDRVLVVTFDEYTPPPSLAGYIRRISDVEYESLTSKPPSKAKTK